jgi:hypothetical protein
MRPHPPGRFPRRASRIAATVILLAGAALLVAPAALATTASPLHLTVTAPSQQFTSTSCTDPENPFLCVSTATGEVLSNLSTTPGTVDYTLVVDFSPGFDAPCNTVDETGVFTFDTGTITVRSHHRDCPGSIRPGPRIVTEFVVTGGTGAFAGATGSGTELGSGSIVYNGTIAF